MLSTLTALLQSYVINEEKELLMLTPFIEKSNITLCYGLSGSGKTVFLIQHLNSNGVEPLLIDFDGNKQSHFKPLNLDLKTTILRGGDFIQDVFTNPQLREDLKGHTLIIDTWKLFNGFMAKKGIDTEVKVLERLNQMLRAIEGLTIIIVTHADCFSNKEDIPDISSEVYSHINGRLNIKVHTTTSKRTYTLFLDKVRGYVGDKIIPLREDVIKKRKT